jgi:hypothetical protein
MKGEKGEVTLTSHTESSNCRKLVILVLFDMFEHLQYSLDPRQVFPLEPPHLASRETAANATSGDARSKSKDEE